MTTPTSSSVTLRWSRPAGTSSSTYTVQLTSGTTVRSFTVTNGSQNVMYSISSLDPFTSYTVNVTIGTISCVTSFTTSEAGTTSAMAIFR